MTAKKKNSIRKTIPSKEPGIGGRPSLFRGKSASPESGNASKVPQKRSLYLTHRGSSLLDQHRERLGVSVNEFVEGLIRKYGPSVSMSDLRSVADG